MTNAELVRLFAEGFVPALAVITAGIPFYVHYRSRVNDLLADLKAKIKERIWIQFREPLEDDTFGIRDAEDANLPLKYLRVWGHAVYRGQYWELAVRKAGLFAVGAGLCWFGRYLLDYKFASSASASVTIWEYSVTLGMATVQSSLLKASLVLGILFAFFAFLVVLRFEIGDEDPTVPHPRD